MTDLTAKQLEFLNILNDKSKKEQPCHRFLEENTQFIPEEFIQNHGLHMNLIFTKPPFGADYKADFMYLAKSTVDWNAIHIEIEDPHKEIFRDDDTFTAEFNAAIQQVESWRGWLDDLANQGYFKSFIDPIKKPISDTPVFHKFVLVYGRRDEISTRRRKDAWRAKKRDNFTLMTYDSLLEHPTQAKHLAKFINGKIKIICSCDIDYSFLAFGTPEDFLVPDDMKERVLTQKKDEIIKFDSKKSNNLMIKSHLEDQLKTLGRVKSYK